MRVFRRAVISKIQRGEAVRWGGMAGGVKWHE